MKLEVAKKYGEEVHKKVEELNNLIKNASQEGIHVDLEILEINNFGERYYRILRPEVKINTADLDD